MRCILNVVIKMLQLFVKYILNKVIMMLHIVMFEQAYYNLAYLLSYWVVARPRKILTFSFIDRWWIFYLFLTGNG